MAVRVIIFDIGGGLKHTTNPAIFRAWESRLGLAEGELPAIVYDGPLAFSLRSSRSRRWKDSGG